MYQPLFTESKMAAALVLCMTLGSHYRCIANTVAVISSGFD